MAEKVKAVPQGMHTITPHLVVQGGAKAIEFYQKAFGAEIKGVHHTPDGKVMHAELRFGDSTVMLADEFPRMGTCASPKTLGGTSFNLFQFWGDRYGQLKDPFGHVWALAQHVEDVTPEEMERRGREFSAQMAKSAG